MNYMLLKFISNEKFLDDFLNGNLYTNTLYYYWNQYALDMAQERRDRDLKNNPNLDPENYTVPIVGGPGPGVVDLFEGTVTTERLEDSNLLDEFKAYAQTDLIYRSVGIGYCNTLCFFTASIKSCKKHFGELRELGGGMVKMKCDTNCAIHPPTQSIRPHTLKIRKKAIQTPMKPCLTTIFPLKNTHPKVADGG